MRESIPKLIWQTQNFSQNLTPDTISCMNSWAGMNPSWEIQFCSDELILEFFESFHNSETLELYRSLPTGVMRADFWRYSILHEFGGLYTDIDTKCILPIDEWLNTTDGERLHVACDHGKPLFCHWTIASPRHHPLLKSAIDLIFKRISEDGGIDKSREDYAGYYTGAGLWTSAIQNFLGTTDDPMEILSDPQKWIESDIKIHPGSFFDGDVSWHLNLSYHWMSLPKGHLIWMDDSSYDLVRMRAMGYI